MPKSNDDKSNFPSGQGSKPCSIGMHLFINSCSTTYTMRLLSL